MKKNKQCSTCGAIKSIKEFNKVAKNKDGKDYSCQPCARLRVRKWRKTHKKSAKLSAKRAYKKYKKSGLLKINRTKWKKRNLTWYKNYWLQKRYGISLEQYHQMLEAQNNTCAICEKHVNDVS